MTKTLWPSTFDQSDEEISCVQQKHKYKADDNDNDNSNDI